MGNSIGIKLTSIKENSLLKKIKLGKDPSFSILPYIYFISKINDIPIDSDIKHEFIEKFTLRNIYTEKEFDINIDKIKSDKFSNEFSFKIEDFPKINQVLILSSIKENSISEKCNLKKEQIILLGNEKKYFQSINDVIQCVNSNNKKFIFFNFIEDKVFQIDFNEKIKVFNFENKEELGFECQEITINYFLKFYYESEWGKDQMNKYNNQTEHIDNKNKESLTDKKNIEENNSNMSDNETNNNKDNNEVNNIQDNNIQDNNIQDNNIQDNIIQDNNNKDNNIQDNNNKDNNIQDNNNKDNNKNNNIQDNNEVNNIQDNNKKNDLKDNIKENNKVNENIIEKNENDDKNNGVEIIKNINSEVKENNNNMMKESINKNLKSEENNIKNNIIKENENDYNKKNTNHPKEYQNEKKIKKNIFKIKEKYKKNFPIYSQIDSNFRFIHKDKNNASYIDSRDKIIIDSIDLKESKITGYDIYLGLIEE